MTPSAPWFADVDVSAWIGPYPFRDVPHPDPEVLVRVLERERIQRAWVGWLPGVWHRDPSAGNARLRHALAPFAGVLQAAPAVRPDWPAWQRVLSHELKMGVGCIRAYPSQWGYGPGEPSLLQLAAACGEAGVPLHLTVRFEDLRQRHRLDSAEDLSAASIRAVARAGTRCTLVVSGAGRELIEQIWWGLTPDERQYLRFDFGWVWGPPEEHFAHLVRTVDASAWVVGSQWPLRLVQQSRALCELLPSVLRQSLTFAERQKTP